MKSTLDETRSDNVGLHSCEQARIRDKLRKEDANYLAEYARKIYQEHAADFHARVEGCMYDLPLHTDDGEISQILHIIIPGDGHIRDAHFVIDGYSDEGDRQLYEFSYGQELEMSENRGAAYETMPLQDEDMYQSAFKQVAGILRSTGVEMPVTSPQDEANFWDIALETCYEDMGESIEQTTWQYIDTLAPTKNLKEMFDTLESARATLEMSLGAQALAGVFSAYGSTKEEVSRLYWRHALRRHVEAKR